MLKTLVGKVFDLQSELAYKAALRDHTQHLPLLEERDRQIVDEIKREGAYVTSVDELGLGFTADLLQAAYAQLAKMPAMENTQTSKKLPQIYTVTDIPEFSQWGREQRLLNIVENYIGLPIAFQGVHLRKDFPNNHQFGPLLWHRDSEDRRMVKIIIYLTDVQKEHGPFEYVPVSSLPRHGLKSYQVYYKLLRSGYLGITDAQLQLLVPQSAWKSCPGPAGTVIIADPSTTLHHGTLRTQERAALFFAYTAQVPKRPELCTQYWDDTFTRLKPEQEVYLAL